LRCFSCGEDERRYCEEEEISWEQRKLGELAFITTGKLDANAAKKDGEYNFFTCGKEILKTNSYAFDGEAILINGNGDLGYTRKYVGKFNAYQRTYVLQGFVMDYEYIEHAIHKFLPDRIKNESIGGAMPYIKIDSLMNLELPIPVVQEAVAVTRFLNELDSLLSLHQRKLEKLKILKKAMLEKMFPKNGAKVPEIRFSGFTDDWEQRKLEEVASETRGGGTPKTSNETYWNGDIPWIQSSDLKEDELFEVKPRKYVSKIGLNKSATQLVEANSIAVVTRVGVGKLALMPHSYATSQDFVSLSRLQVAPYFAVYSIHHMLQEELEVVQGTSIKGMTKEDLLSKSLLIPVDMGEQTQLGGLFYKLDSLISLHQRKLEKLRQIKKSMLERMFV